MAFTISGAARTGQGEQESVEILAIVTKEEAQAWPGEATLALPLQRLGCQQPSYGLEAEDPAVPFAAG